MYLLDTDTCIYWLNGDTQLDHRIMETGLDQVAVCAMTTAELYYGAYKSSRTEHNLDSIHLLTDRVTLWESLTGIDRLFGQTKADLEKRGTPIQEADILIASFALKHHATLVTNNVRDFQRIPHLQVENWRTTKK